MVRFFPGFINFFFFVTFFMSVSPTLSMYGDIDDILEGIQHLYLEDEDIDDGYYSDSEDEEGYTYRGLPDFQVHDNCRGKRCVALARGIHFSPSKFSREQISAMRRSDDAHKDIFASAAYDLAKQPLGSDQKQDEVRKKAGTLKDAITQLGKKDRNRLQQVYSNQYDKFHQLLGSADDCVFKKFISKMNPQVSTGENFFHAEKYASGLKFLGSNMQILDPEYDNKGKPKHPYVGKLFVILASTDRIKELKPYFVVRGHANDDVTISTHYSNNVLEEREVSFAGYVPGDCVAFSVPVRVPSFNGEYKNWYQDKFGLSKRAYNSRKKIITTGSYYKKEDLQKKTAALVRKTTIKSMLEKVILPHLEQKLKSHIQAACAAKNITLVYKQLSGEFGTALPSIQSALTFKEEKKCQE